jgi:hypothetical protein
MLAARVHITLWLVMFSFSGLSAFSFRPDALVSVSVFHIHEKFALRYC